MKIVSIGGGPAGLYAAILFKRLDPLADITVIERNRPDDTFGWGVVFSAETLGNLEAADPESYRAITEQFIYWDDIDTHYQGSVVSSTGHGFCGMSRMRLLNLLQARCRELGVELRFEQEVAGVHEFPEADLILAADGINSRVRDADAEHFGPQLDWRKCRFAWLGTTRPMDAFTFVFEADRHGIWQAHAYPFEDGLGTFIVETREETWRAAGLDQADEATTVAYCEALFADFLEGHPLLTNRSIWRSFPTVSCRSWVKDNVVLLGDACHTAHFSIGSGTKLAMEDAIALVEVFRELGPPRGPADIRAALAEYEDRRWVEVLKLQKAAQTSLEWFENVERYAHQPPLAFNFNLMSRSKRITWDNMVARDPEYMAAVKSDFAERAGAPPMADGRHPEPMFAPFTLRGLSLANRVVVSPMCQYRAEDGLPNDWHFVHLASRAIGGAGLVITEMTDVSSEGRISPGCACLETPEQMLAWRRIVDFVHAETPAKICLQLGHAGRKGSTRRPWEPGGDRTPLAEGNWPLLAASAIAFHPGGQVPKAMDEADMEAVIADHRHSAELAIAAGFDMLELHMAHGYLLSSFISPLSNQRQDAFGGTIEGRMRFPLAVFDAIRAVWPAERPMSVRISASDWAPGGLSDADLVALAGMLKAQGCDLIDVSSGQTSSEADPEYGRMYQAPFSERIRLAVGIPTLSVGAIQGADHVNTLLAAGRADLCALARPHLSNPYLTLQAAQRYDYWDMPWPKPYLTVKPRQRPARDRRSESLGLPRPAFEARGGWPAAAAAPQRRRPVIEEG
ncbi:MAG: bifunctional salicylyl-CoA 5-hydroxylase/oxidoreductase [Chloroflexi bacterium]|nr:bifunctional salicylyl-CoA 5-hydroxylase/oxidoreductase [Chloroflexota bacterium]